MAARINLGTIAIRRATTPTIPLVFDAGDLVDYTAVMRVYDDAGVMIFPEKVSIAGASPEEDLFVFTLEETTPFAGRPYYTEIDIVAPDASIPYGYTAQLRIEGKPVKTDPPPAPVVQYQTQAMAQAAGSAEVTARAAADTALAGRASSLEGRATGLEGRTTTVENSASSALGRVAVVEGKATGLTWTALHGHEHAFADDATHTGQIVNIDHHGLLGGGSQNYGINILNRPDNPSAPTQFTGANTAFVIHQYSDIAPAFQIDNTRSYPFILLKNAENPGNSAGTHGTGSYLDLWGYSANAAYPGTGPIRLAQLNSLLAFVSYDDSRPWTFQSQTSAPSLLAYGLNGTGVSVQASGGVGVNVAQSGAYNAIAVVQSGAAIALSVVANAGAAGLFPLAVTGQDWGPSFTTSTDGGNVLSLTKNGTGAGTPLKITHKGTGFAILVSNGTANTFILDKDGMPQIGVANSAAPPTASSSNRGKLWFQGNGAGVKDNVYVCAKDAGDAYAWRPIY